MAILERCTQNVIAKEEDMIALEKKFDALEAKMGHVPPKRRYYAMYGALPAGTMVWEREWENMAAIEAYNDKAMNSPEWASAFQEAAKVFADTHFELFWKMDPLV
jgi:hypothetical protein